MKNELLTPEAVADRIRSGACMAIAGDEALLAALPQGNWIGGTSVYFVTETGGAVVRDMLYCTIFDTAEAERIRVLAPDDLSDIPAGYVDGGATIILIPAFSKAHTTFAVEGASYSGVFAQPLVGWIAGVHLDDLGKVSPKVFDGTTGTAHEEGAVLMHLATAPGSAVDLDIVNIFSEGDREALTVTFPETGFTTRTAVINGEEVVLSEYLTGNQIDTRLPLVANYGGALINVSVQTIDTEAHEVAFYAPVMAGVEYTFARPLPDYAGAFAAKLGEGANADYACNCILNYLYGELEGKSAGSFTGPMTFGEIAYMLLNQTLVRLEIKEAA